ncbi:hypothetical protein [Sphaerisporangium krabiense]|uniref:Tetratricopeptide repeat protein n=1 Tax=Sphaerisporangium krabiense TaxID=763782 RepID=A0A7W9DMN7_9ACTN|nr:hypothetical protein [Sphaerisporangium krabiense]MBB5624576.1 hypothetical protein [Sphaerisporangium krabiense]
MRKQVGTKASAALLAGWTAWQPFAGCEGGIEVPASLTSLVEARTFLTDAFARVLAFLSRERGLYRAVLRAVPEAAADLNGPLHRDAVVGPILQAARHGRCGVLSDWLAPVLAAAHSPVHVVGGHDLRLDADLLSDLAVRMSAQNTGGRAVRAEALWSFWFQQCVVGRAGPAAEQRERAEHDLRAGDAAEPPLTRLARSMLDGRHDLPATVDAYVEAAREAARAENWERCSDSLSRAGLAALRLGDWDRAGALLAESEHTARARLGETDPRVTRALSDRAELSALSGRPDRALAEIHQSLRAHAREDGPARDARLRPSERVHALALAEHGYVTRALSLAFQLAGAPVDAAGHAKDLLLHARVLRRAGRPGEALERMTAAEHAHRATPCLEDRIERARCELDLARPARARAVLAEPVDHWSWYARRVSPRLAFEALILHAVAGGDAAALAARRQEALDWGVEADDQLFDEFGWARARLLRGAPDVAGAFEEARRVGDAQERRIAAGRLFAWHPAVAATRLELAECAEAAGVHEDAWRDYQWIVDDPALDEAHPLRLAAVLGQVRLARREGDPRAVALLKALPPPGRWPLDADLETTDEMTRLRRLLRLDG